MPGAGTHTTRMDNTGATYARTLTMRCIDYRGDGLPGHAQ